MAVTYEPFSGQWVNDMGHIVSAQDASSMMAQQAPAAPSAPGQYGPVAAPERPSFLNGSLTMPAELQIQNSYDPSYLNQYANYATSTEESPWLQLQRQQIGSDYANRGSQLQQQQAGGVNKGMEQLAMRRGLSGGAGERLAASGVGAGMMGQQGLAREREDAIRQMQIAEQTGKTNAMGQLPGMEIQRAQQEMAPQQYNIGNVLNEREREFGAEMDAYKTQMAAWAAEQQANATGAAGGGGGMCFITTAVCEYMGLSDDCEMLNAFRKLRDEYMKKDEKMLKEVEEYYKIAPVIVDLINKSEHKESILRDTLIDYLIPAFKEIKNKNYKKAYEIYVELVSELKDEFTIID